MEHGLTTGGGGDGAGQLALEPDEAAMRVGWRVQGRRDGSEARAARWRRRRGAWWRSGWDLRRGRSMAGGRGRWWLGLFSSSGSARGLVGRGGERGQWRLGAGGRPGKGRERCEVGSPNTFRRGIGRRPPRWGATPPGLWGWLGERLVQLACHLYP
jgi:hypothetical protein